MGAIVMKQFIDRFKAMEKIANETLAANPAALVGVDSLPGSEHDAKVPAEAKKPDEEVQKGLPADATSTAGAVAGGDAKPLNEGKLEMDQQLTNPEQKPLTSDEALTAKVANDRLTGLVKDLLSDLNGTQKTAGAVAEQKPAAEGDGAVKEKQKKAENKISLDDETISKLAAAQATFMLGREAAEKVLKEANAKEASAKDLTSDDARTLIKAACMKVAQEQGLNPEEAAVAADNAMAAAGLHPEAGAAEAGAGTGAEAGSAAGSDAGEGAVDPNVGIPNDVTEEELATAIIDCVQSGDITPDAAKALVEEITSDNGAGEPSEDEAAAIIAQALENGEITPEQAQEIATAVENGASSEAGSGEAAPDAGAAAAEQGAADAEAAVQDAKDEAQGMADAEAAMKAAAAQIRADAISKVASAVLAKREQVNKEAAAKETKTTEGSKIMAKVASILQAKKEAAAQKTSTSDESYIAGFKKKASELGVDPAQLAKYMLDRQQAK